MKINSQTSKKKKVIITGIVLLLLAVSAVAAAAITKIGPFASVSEPIDLNEPTKEQIEAGNRAKTATIENGDKSTSTGSDPLPVPSPAATPGGKSTVGSQITSASQDGETYRIRAFIQTLSSTGTCSLKMTGPGGKTYVATVGVQPIASSTTCKGFDIPMTNLTQGSWNIDLTFENDSIMSNTTKTVTIQ